MNRIILDEKSFAQECLQTKTTDIDTYSTMMILAKYFHYCGYSQKDIYSSLIDFLVDSKSIDYAKNKRYWEETCERISIKAPKYRLLDIKGVWITKKELDKIEELNNKVLERLTFTFLCLAKYNSVKYKDSYWVNIDYKYIFSMARVTCKADERESKLCTLIEKGYIEPSKQIDNLNMNVIFVDKDTKEFSEDNGDLLVFDFRELGYEYRKYCGENFIRCAECGILTKGNKNNTKRYCSNCVKETPKPNNKEIVCSDCGKIVVVSKYNSKTCRCKDCQREADKNTKKIWIKNNRAENSQM